MTQEDKKHLKAICYTVATTLAVVLLYAILTNLDTVLHNGILVP